MRKTCDSVLIRRVLELASIYRSIAMQITPSRFCPILSPMPVSPSGGEDIQELLAACVDGLEFVLLGGLAGLLALFTGQGEFAEQV